MASKYRQKYELPQGFYNVLEDYSREVLRDQPQDILEFSYMYFKAMEEVSKSIPIIKTTLNLLRKFFEVIFETPSLLTYCFYSIPGNN